MRILLDTNMLLDAVKFRIDILNEAQKFGEPFTLSACINELKRMTKGKDKAGVQAKLALHLIKELTVVTAQGRADSTILRYAMEHSCAVATNDKKLIKALKSKGIRTIRLRQKKYLVED